jgi:hypothetical protein
VSFISCVVDRGAGERVADAALVGRAGEHVRPSNDAVVRLALRPAEPGNNRRGASAKTPLLAASIFTTSIFCMVIIALNTRLASPPPAATTSVSTGGAI